LILHFYVLFFEPKLLLLDLVSLPFEFAAFIGMELSEGRNDLPKAPGYLLVLMRRGDIGKRRVPVAVAHQPGATAHLLNDLSQAFELPLALRFLRCELFAFFLIFYYLSIKGYLLNLNFFRILD
jgi:hypothetical protein